ncbi:class I SAM-dependent rRNA methyltransferase [Isosphaeraceae bacterium EP7]
MSAPVRVTLGPRRARPFFARHPWVYVQSIARVDVEPAAGDEVVVVSHENQFVARGLFNPASAIRVRLYRWDDQPLDDAFWLGRLDAALALRNDVLDLSSAPNSACRLVFSEADGLSGLTVDRFDRWLAVQFTSRALYERRDLILDHLIARTGAEGVILRTEKGIGQREGLVVSDGPVRGTMPDGPIEIVENGLTFAVDLATGQKTGFYLDQRDNRRATAALAKGRSVLDLFTYSGGFALNALAAGATSALGVDSSAPALALARRNAERNNLPATFEQADVFDFLEAQKAAGTTYGMVVCDPPKFARSAANVDDALKAYLRLNRLALSVLEPGGILVTFSCSGLVDRRMFADLLGRVAELSERPIQILEQRGAALDHPVAASCLETDYLSCLLCRVL